MKFGLKNKSDCKEMGQPVPGHYLIAIGRITLLSTLPG